MQLGESLEDYLECLLVLEKSGKIRSVDVASHLHVSKPSVNKAMGILKDHGYILQESYGDIHLTEAGRQQAREVLERHEVLHHFLVDILQVSDDAAACDACKIEHIICEETFLKLKEYYHKHK